MLPDESTLDYQNLLRLRLFKGLDLVSARKYLDRVEHLLYTKGEIILSPRIPNNDLYVLLSGILTVHLDSPESDLIATIKPGECAGEMSLFDDDIPSAYVIAADTSKILKISEEIVWGMIDNCEGFARNFLYITSTRIRTSNRTMSNSRKVQQHYEQRANIDSLTRLHNRNWIDKTFPKETETCIAEKIPLCLMIIDIDGFKKYNDEHGHLAGDQCLKSVADTIRSNIRPNDLLGRFGGEEFVILLPGTTKIECISIGERINNEVERGEIIDSSLNKLPSVTVSIGITKAKLGDFYEDMFSIADKALYKAKEEGKNRVCIQ